MRDFDLTTETGVRCTRAQILDLRREIAGGAPLTTEQQCLLCDVALAALGRLWPTPTPAEPDTRPVPPWLRRLQEGEDFDARR